MSARVLRAPRCSVLPGTWRQRALSARAQAAPEHAQGRAVTPRGGRPELRRTTEAFICPACGNASYLLPALWRHLQRCCPDLWRGPEEWQAAGTDAAAMRALLHAAAARETAQRQNILELSFRGVDASGAYVRRDVPEVAAMLSLPLTRTADLLRRAKRDIPLVADAEPIQVLFEDDYLIAVSKPPGLITAPKHRHVGGSLLNRVISHLGRPPLPVHRLDQDTSGVVLFSKDKATCPRVHAQFQRQRVQKRYLAVVLGTPAATAWIEEGPIDFHPTQKVARAVTAGGRPSRTEFEVLASRAFDFSEDATPGLLGPALPSSLTRAASLVRCTPRTGRTHQIRVHLAATGHPILSDEIYGLQVPWAPRMLLHAAELELAHPATGQPLRVTAPLPADFLHALGVLGLPGSTAQPGAECAGT